MVGSRKSPPFPSRRGQLGFELRRQTLYHKILAQLGISPEEFQKLE